MLQGTGRNCPRETVEADLQSRKTMTSLYEMCSLKCSTQFCPLDGGMDPYFRYVSVYHKALNCAMVVALANENQPER